MPQPGLWPRLIPRTTESEAERKVFQALETQLPKGWYAWHSLRIRSEHGSDGEGDFTLADPARGILILEVKGGQITLSGGHWLQNSAPMKQAPRVQANGFGRRLVERLQTRKCAPPAWGVATCFPDTSFDQQPTQDDVSGCIIGQQDLAWLAEALKSVMDRALAHQCPPRGPWIEELHAMWGESWPPRLRLGQRARLDENDRQRLDANQIGILECMDRNERLLVEGGAGTGKTLLAREAAFRLAAASRRVLLLCFTEPLAGWLAQQTRHPNIEVSTVRRCAANLVGEAGLDVGDMNAPGFWQQISWRAAAEAIPSAAIKWDAIVIDEGQDFAPEDWLLIDELSKEKTLWAFWDPSQAFWPDRPMRDDLFAAQFRLSKSYRCPEPIRQLADAFIGKPADEGVIKRALADGTIGIVACPSDSSIPRKLATEIDKLRSEGLTLADIAIVSLRGNAPAESIVHVGALGSYRLVRADSDQIDSNVIAETFLRFKGLERPAILVTDLHLAAGRSDIGKRIHIALTRALTAVRIIDSRDAIHGNPILSRLIASRTD
jgi:hypothetical protein